MATTVIKWRLNQMLAEKRLTSRALAESLGIHENSVYRLRKEDKMPRLNHDTLNGICNFLGCQPGDLLSFEEDFEPIICATATITYNGTLLPEQHKEFLVDDTEPGHGTLLSEFEADGWIECTDSDEGMNIRGGVQLDGDFNYSDRLYKQITPDGTNYQIVGVITTEEDADQFAEWLGL